MQVSFGKIYNVCHNPSGTTAMQNEVSHYINDVFSKKQLSHDNKSVADLLEEKRKVDVAIISQKNNVIRVELQKPNPMCYMYGEEYMRPFVPYAGNSTKKLRLDINLNEQLSYIPQKLTRFVNKCMNYAVNPKSRCNICAEDAYFEKYERKMEAYNKKLEKLGVVYDIID